MTADMPDSTPLGQSDGRQSVLTREQVSSLHLALRERCPWINEKGWREIVAYATGELSLLERADDPCRSRAEVARW